ncbi:hypothetical protein GCM10007301_09650 [Azorhizobium oxalatiphilum]|uniref:DUF429 domain-containing protein n=1 Tax=Azorhizobium oxalatiphilum TaxID=980631 RepID=A0A917F809_9HYPH|nr:DUF429 domain-containing protein [Azorhizobium oxalatiphilum]GGF52243.1 hypothetical protein GCM10007301_09650 [Azorhizobium oxalatiphilum]
MRVSGGVLSKVSGAGQALPDVVGLDGCPGGWIAAHWSGAGTLTLSRIAHLADLFPAGAMAPVAAIDIPIGLPAVAGEGGRPPERHVRPLLGGRQSSVFSVPSRAAVEAAADIAVPEGERYRHACAVALETSQPPRKISKQAFMIFPKILEADALLRHRPDLPLTECHPEVSFWAMNDKQPLSLPKKVKGAPDMPGLVLRIGLLAAQGLPVDRLTRERARSLGAGLDDLVDACACAWSARRIALGTALSFPDPPERDGFGLRVAIVA